MTIRLKLTIGSIVVILLANSLLSLVNIQYLERAWRDEVQTRVRLDLNSARAAYESHLESIARFLSAASLDRTLADALANNNREELARLAQNLYRAGGIDMISLLDARGKILYRPRNPGGKGEDLSTGPLISRALKTRQLARGTLVYSRERLLAEGPDLAARAQFEVRPTPNTPETRDKTRTDGLVVAAVIPVFDGQKNLVGLLFGGDLLNRRYELVDRIRQDVFPADLYGQQPTGNVTIFQGDLRIATNVILDDGSRAVGTRMSSEVQDAVLANGTPWDDRAFVVNDWYITSYEPIRDPDGRIVGALYVGLLEAPLARQQNMVTAVVLLTTFLATVACVLLMIFVTMLVLRPIGQVVAMARRVIQGDLSARVGARPPGEMGVLCQAIDQMTEAVAHREREQQQMTQQQIGRSEKLASIGRLAAGIAHEINNPLTGVLTFAHLLRDKPNMDDQDKQDLELIIHETTRAAEIVRNLLDFARERAAIKEPLNINDVITRTIRLIRNQKLFDKIVIEERFGHDLPDVDGNMNQLQQVFLNLALNACEAMPKGGTITITSTCRDGKVRVDVADTGCGIKKEHLDRIFEPFFTTKAVGKGTGLGLAVSYGIIEQHGGTLEVETEEGKGTTFTIVLPTASGRVI